MILNLIEKKITKILGGMYSIQSSKVKHSSIARREWGRGSGEGTVGRGVYRKYYKGHMDKIKGEGGGGEVRV